MSLRDTPAFEAVGERDVDLLLMEEVESDAAFVEWLAIATSKLPPTQIVDHRVWHSVSTGHGESDLLIVAKGADNSTFALMVENKIDAPPQPEQAARYRLRGEQGVQAGDWQVFASYVIAPARYLENPTHVAGYDAAVSYEKISEWLQDFLPASRRTSFRRSLLVAAIEQQRRGYSPKVDPVVTRFFTEYWQLSESIFPELKFSHVPIRPTNSTWAEFRPAVLPKMRRIVHKVPEGYVDLEFGGLGKSVEQLNVSNPMIAAVGMRFFQTNKSASLRVPVAKMNSREDFAGQRDLALLGLKAAHRLATVSPLVQLPSTDR